MNLTDVVVIAVVAVVVGLVLYYIHRSKKKGIQCIGCPDAPKCSGNCAGCSGHCNGQS